MMNFEDPRGPALVRPLVELIAEGSARRVSLFCRFSPCDWLVVAVPAASRGGRSLGGNQNR